MLTGGIVALLNGRLAGRIAAALQEKIDPLAPGQLSGGSDVSSHFFLRFAFLL
jgi:hypothetical protein